MMVNTIRNLKKAQDQQGNSLHRQVEVRIHSLIAPLHPFLSYRYPTTSGNVVILEARKDVQISIT